MTEELFEYGVVIKSENGIAEIALNENSSCEECSAKIFCSPASNNLRTLLVSDTLHSKKGDEVKISVKGQEVLKASFLLYGVPLLLLLFGIIIGTNIFKGTNYSELISFFLGFVITSIYYVLFYIKNYKNKKSFLPSKIISIQKPISL